jgi:hypothetical protein
LTPRLPGGFERPDSRDPNLFWLPEFDSIEITDAQPPLLWRRLLEQADLCFEHAAQAAQGKRFSAACGLIVTAQELLRRAQIVHCSSCDHLVLERAIIIRLDRARHELEELLDLAVDVRLYAL